MSNKALFKKNKFSKKSPQVGKFNSKTETQTIKGFDPVS